MFQTYFEYPPDHIVQVARRNLFVMHHVIYYGLSPKVALGHILQKSQAELRGQMCFLRLDVSTKGKCALAQERTPLIPELVNLDAHFEETGMKLKAMLSIALLLI